MTSTGIQTATFGGGCFWCLEAVFQMTEGVSRVKSGYMGGHTADPSYALVCTGTTGHAEVVQVDFDPEVIAFRDLLEIFFGIHDPTTPNRQGNDVGTQYRSAVFYHTPEQASEASAFIEELGAEDVWDDPIVTEVTEAGAFYPAEADHDDYFSRNGQQPYCRAVIAPKVSKYRKRFAHRLRRDASA
ncbi:MAG: peptide-methionine (S)-S-oxide reductase MsrA [Gemmatimonadota bacterium]